MLDSMSTKIHTKLKCQNSTLVVLKTVKGKEKREREKGSILFCLVFLQNWLIIPAWLEVPWVFSLTLHFLGCNMVNKAELPPLLQAVQKSKRNSSFVWLGFAIHPFPYPLLPVQPCSVLDISGNLCGMTLSVGSVSQLVAVATLQRPHSLIRCSDKVFICIPFWRRPFPK